MAWYASAVAFASQCGIMIGTGDGRFSPDGPAPDQAITREQLAAIFMRALQPP